MQFQYAGCVWKVSFTINTQSKVIFGHLVFVSGRYFLLRCSHILGWLTRKLSSSSKTGTCWVVLKTHRIVFTTWCDNAGIENQNNVPTFILFNKTFIRSALTMTVEADLKRINVRASSSEIYDLLLSSINSRVISLYVNALYALHCLTHPYSVLLTWPFINMTFVTFVRLSF